MTPPRLGRGHLIFGAGLVVIGLILIFDAFSSSGMVVPSIPGIGTIGEPITRNSWFFPHSYPEFEWMWALIALGAAIVWVGGSIGWWIVRTIIWHWFQQTWKDAKQ